MLKPSGGEPSNTRAVRRQAPPGPRSLLQRVHAAVLAADILPAAPAIHEGAPRGGAAGTIVLPVSEEVVMLDVKQIRAEPDKVREALAAKGETADIDRWLDLDRLHREKTTQWQQCRAELNAGGEAVSRAKKEGRDASEAIARLKDVKARDKALKEEVEALEPEMERIFLRIPNIPAPDVPRGTDATGNLEVSTWGEKPAFAFAPKAHWDLGAALGIIDFEPAARSPAPASRSSSAPARGSSAR